MFNIEKCSIKAKAIPLLKVVLSNEGKKPDFDNTEVLETMYVEKYGKKHDSFNDLFLFRESLVQKYSDIYEAEKQYNSFQQQFDNILLTEHKFSQLCSEIADHLQIVGMNAIRLTVNGLQLQAQFSRHQNEFVNFSPFSSTFNPSKAKAKINTTLVNDNKSVAGNKRQFTIDNVIYSSIADYAIKNKYPDSVYITYQGKHRPHAPLVRAYALKHGVTLP